MLSRIVLRVSFLVFITINGILATIYNESDGNDTTKGFMQNTRLRLKKLKKWTGLYKAEVNLAKCVAKSVEEPFSIFARSYPATISVPDCLGLDCLKSDSVTDVQSLDVPEPEFGYFDVALVHMQFWYEVATRLFHDLIYEPFVKQLWENPLFCCAKEYIVEKFWAWVEDAPDD